MAKNYLYQHTSGYIFRYRVPQDVFDILRQREFRYSLRTGSLRTAKQRAELLSVKLKGFIMEIRAGVNHPLPVIKEALSTLLSDFDSSNGPVWFSTVISGGNTPEDIQNVSMRFSELVARYVEENQTWRTKSKQENEAIYAMFIRVMGDMPLPQITRKVVSDYKRLLLRLPPRVNLHKRYRKMTIKQILKEKHKQTSSPTTVNKHLVRLSTIFKYAVHNGLTEHNPATEMQVKTNKRDDQLRAAYTKEDLDKLFLSDDYLYNKHRHSYQYWMPLLGLYTGARLEELAQLHLEDIREVDGVWVLDINDKHEKRIKTKSSMRLIPLHPFLVDDLGIVRHAQKLREQSHKRLFPELSKRRDGYGMTVSKWFNERYKVKCGVTKPANGARLDFHSFRHTFVNTLKQLQVNPDLIRELDGHKKGDMTMDRYGKAFGPRLLLDEAVSKLDYRYPQLALSYSG